MVVLTVMLVWLAKWLLAGLFIVVAALILAGDEGPGCPDDSQDWQCFCAAVVMWPIFAWLVITE